MKQQVNGDSDVKIGNARFFFPLNKGHLVSCWEERTSQCFFSSTLLRLTQDTADASFTGQLIRFELNRNHLSLLLSIETWQSTCSSEALE